MKGWVVRGEGVGVYVCVGRRVCVVGERREGVHRMRE